MLDPRLCYVPFAALLTPPAVVLTTKKELMSFVTHNSHYSRLGFLFRIAGYGKVGGQGEREKKVLCHSVSKH